MSPDPRAVSRSTPKSRLKKESPPRVQPGRAEESMHTMIDVAANDARQARGTVVDRALIAHVRRAADWHVMPYGWWTEVSGAHVIFDRKYRPLCRRHNDGHVEIVPSDTWTIWVKEDWLYSSPDTPYTRPKARNRVLGVVQRLGLADEIKRRRSLDRRGLLPLAPIQGRADK
jgi:hypothetical protein